MEHATGRSGERRSGVGVRAVWLALQAEVSCERRGGWAVPRTTMAEPSGSVGSEHLGRYRLGADWGWCSEIQRATSSSEAPVATKAFNSLAPMPAAVRNFWSMGQAY